MTETSPCPQCGRVIATHIESPRCPACGFLLASMSSGGMSTVEEALDAATRPAAPRLDSAQALVSSDEEAGSSQAQQERQFAPVWPIELSDPTTNALPDANSDALGAATADLPAHLLPPTQALPTTDVPSAAVDDSGGRSGARNGARRVNAPLAALSIVAVVILLLAVSVVAVLASAGSLPQLGGLRATPATHQPTATSTATPTMLIYTNVGHYSIAHPASLLIVSQQESAPTGLVIFSNGAAASMDIEYINTGGSQNLVAQDDLFLKTFAAPNTALQQKSAPVPVTIGAQSWTQEEVDVTLAVNGQASFLAHVVVASTTRGPYTYTIAYLAPATNAFGPDATFAHANSAIFQPMLQTFTFLG